MRGLRMLALLTDADGAPGGIAQFNRDLLDALDASPSVAGVDTICYTRHPPRAPAMRKRVRPGVATRSRARFVWHTWRRARATGPVNLVLCGHLHLAPVAWLAARTARCPYWVILHGVEAWPRPRRLRAFAMQRARGLVTVSRYTRARALEWWLGTPDAISIIPDTVDGRFTPGAADPALAQRLGLAGRDVLLTVGRLSASERYKGHDRVIDALPAVRASHPDLVYAIAGDGDDRKRLDRLARQRGVAEHVRFLGHVDAGELPAVYRLARAFAMPSTGEGFGIAFLEAMASGVPVVGLGVDGSRDPLQDGTLGIIAEPDRLAEALHQALDPGIPRGDVLAQRVKALFGREAFRRRVEAWLQRCAEERA
jgi:phosphatidylinositol alpha-1,6-mannosyltransferase